jgi:TonB family protein
LNSPEIDALAAQIIQRLHADQVASLIIVGGGSREGKVTELGVDLRDRLNNALLRQATGIHVLAGAEIHDALKQLRISEGMLYSNALADMIAMHTHAEAVAIIEIGRVDDGTAKVSVKLVDRRATSAKNSKKKKTEVSSAEFQSQIGLTDTQIKSATRDYRPPLRIPVTKAGTDGVGMPWCDYCPKPEYSPEAREKRIQGTVYLLATILPDGTADDILITRPMGFGLDRTAVEKLLIWKFKSAVDAQKRPIASQVQIEIAFSLYH